MSEPQELSRRHFLQRAIAGTASIAGVFTVGGSSLHDSQPKAHPNLQTKPLLPRATMMLMGGSYPVLNMDDIEARLPDKITVEEADPYGHYRKMISLSANQPPIVEFITSASRAYADDNARQYEKLFRFLGAQNVHSTSTHDISKIKNNHELMERLRRADIIYLTGGDQSLLADLFKNTQAHNILRDRFMHDPNLVIAGTSAGAMIMARNMIDGNPKIKGNPTPISEGFAMLPAVIETHTDERDREPRMLSALEQYPGNIGLSLDGATALIIKDGKASVEGPGRVIIAHSRSAATADHGHAIDLSTIKGCAPYKDKGMTAHIYRKGDSFELGEYAHMPAQRYRDNAQSIAIHGR